MKYCSNCSATVVFTAIEGDEHHRFYCESCEVIHYQNPNIIAGCLPIWEDKVLLCRRAIKPRKGLWNLPAGYLENGETVEQGAKREAREEAGIEVELVAPHTIYSIPFVNQVYIHFLANMRTPDFKIGIETLEVKFFTEEDIPWEEMAFHSSIHALECYFADRKIGQHKTHTGVSPYKKKKTQ